MAYNPIDPPFPFEPVFAVGERVQTPEGPGEVTNLGQHQGEPIRYHVRQQPVAKVRSMADELFGVADAARKRRIPRCIRSFRNKGQLPAVPARRRRAVRREQRL